MAFTQASRRRERTFLPFPRTHKHADIYLPRRLPLFLIALFIITRMIADEIYPISGFVFNYIFIDAIYSKFEVIDFSVFQIDKAWI